MTKNYETGHAKNVANFETLIAFCTKYGSTYNPSKAALSVTSLNMLLQQAQTALTQVTTTQTAFNNASNKRADAFKPLKPLATKIVNALDATDATAETVKDARTINRKLQGQRATPVKKDRPVEATDPSDSKTISASQQSYDQQVEHFSKLLELIATDSNYNPNEADLKIVNNQQKLTLLKQANTDVVEMFTSWSNSRLERNNILYTPLSGLIAVALDVKKYIKSLYGASSPQYKQISGLEFKTQKRE